MDKGKLKNIIILVLLAVNVFFAAMCVINAAETHDYERKSEKSMLAALSANGIKVSDASLLKTESIPVCSFSRSLSDERGDVSSVIGSASAEDIGGNIIMYTGKNGQACFRGTGDFEILMESGVIKTTADPAATVASVMKKLGVGIDGGSVDVKSGTGDGASEVTALCSYNKRPIINCRVDFTFSSDSLLLATGSKPLTDIKKTDSVAVLDISTVIMRFLDILNNKGYVCSKIADIGHCYKMDVTAAGTGTLTPIWHFSTDIGDFYINGVTGREETVTQNN